MRNQTPMRPADTRRGGDVDPKSLPVGVDSPAAIDANMTACTQQEWGCLMRLAVEAGRVIAKLPGVYPDLERAVTLVRVAMTASKRDGTGAKPLEPPTPENVRKNIEERFYARWGGPAGHKK